MTQTQEKQTALVNDNLGLVHACANRFRGRGAEYDDLFQAGCVGLVKAAKNFDEGRGFAFSTYAVPVILGEIKRIFRDGGAVKVGRTLKEKARAALRVKEALETELQREVTVSELADKLGVDLHEAAQLLTVSMPVISLTSDDESETRQFDIPVPAPDEALTDRLSLHTVLDTLSEKDRTLICLRYFDGLTQTAVANQLGMSQVQVSRREKVILTELRKKLLA